MKQGFCRSFFIDASAGQKKRYPHAFRDAGQMQRCGGCFDPFDLVLRLIHLIIRILVSLQNS